MRGYSVDVRVGWQEGMRKRSVLRPALRSSLHSKFYKNSVSFTFSPNAAQATQIREQTNSELSAVF